MAAEIWQWITPEGATYRLDSFLDGVEIVEEVDGRGMPPIRRQSELVPSAAGSRNRAVVHDENEVSLGMLFSGSDASAARSVVRTWMGRLDPTRGEGLLRVTGPAGDIRELACSYQDGLRLEEPAGMRHDQLAVVTFVANDPYWADTTDTTATWTAGTLPPTTFFPIFPLRLGGGGGGGGGGYGASTVTNLGDVPTYPVWVVTGPGSDLTLTNLLTGRTLQWGGTLGASEYIVIDTRPGNQSESPKQVLKNDGTNQFGELTAWDFWPFVPGAQDVDIDFTGASVTALWRPRYLGA